MVLAMNFTPSSTGCVSFVSGVPGAAVLGQIVHGQLLDCTAMAMLNAPCAVCGALLESVTCTVKFAVPAVVGVPEISPLVDRVRPAGKLPATSDHL